jgi:hypothetical protein
MSGANDQIMLCGTAITFQSGFFGKLLELSELGGERRTVDASHSGTEWAEVIYSCIKRMTPMQCTIAFDPNGDWKSVLEADPETITITWSIPGNYTTPGTVSFRGAATRIATRGSLEDRMVQVCTITPSGEPTITPGTHV